MWSARSVSTMIRRMFGLSEELPPMPNEQPAPPSAAAPAAPAPATRRKSRRVSAIRSEVVEAELDVLEQVVGALADVEQGGADLLRPLGLAGELGALGLARGQEELDLRAGVHVADQDRVGALVARVEALVLGQAVE